MQEKTLEKKFKDYIESLGGLCLKFEPEQNTGWPDRITLLKNGFCFFAEFKTTGKNLSPLQQHRFDELKEKGYDVFFIDDNRKLANAISFVEKIYATL